MTKLDSRTIQVYKPVVKVKKVPHDLHFVFLEDVDFKNINIRSRWENLGLWDRLFIDGKEAVRYSVYEQWYEEDNLFS